MVYAKLDWYTVMLYNSSIDDILKKLGIYSNLYEELSESGYERSQGFSSVFVFSVYGISLELRFDDYLTTEKESLFSKKYSKIRLDISGSGLDYLRQYLKVDTVFTDCTFWGEYGTDYTITRCDFAYDFVNYKPSFLDDVLRWIKDREYNNLSCKFDTRLNVGRAGGVQYSYRCGTGQKTLYLGSPRADKLVRIYDKYLEQSKNGVLIKPLPEAFKNEESVVSSWFRIEFQSRRKCADEFLYSCNGDIRNVLRVVFDQYLIRDEKGVPLPWMVDLYDWEKLPPIILNTDFIQLDTVLERSYNYITGQALRSIVLYIMRYGLPSFVDVLNKEIIKFSISNSVTMTRRNIAFNNNLARMLHEENLTISDLKGLHKMIFPGIGSINLLSGGTDFYKLLNEFII